MKLASGIVTSAALLTVSLCATNAWAEEPFHSLSFGETVEIPAQTVGESLGCDACCQPQCCPTDPCSHGLWIDSYAGGSYLDTRNDSTAGFTWGAVAGYASRNSSWQPAISFNLNHVEDGTQGVLSLGAARVADPWSCCHADRITALLAVDQYWDDRFNEDVYLGQMRAMLGYQLYSGLEVGAEYWEPLGSGETDLFLGGTSFGAMRPTQAFGAYAVRQIGATTLLGRVNYRERNETIGLGLTLNRSVCERLSLFAVTDYEDRGVWGLSAGLTLRFGSGSGRRHYSHSAIPRGFARDDAGSDTVVRGQGNPVVLILMLLAWKSDKKDDPDRSLWGSHSWSVKLSSEAWSQSVSGTTPDGNGGNGGYEPPPGPG